MWPIVVQFPIIVGWWDASHALWDFSRSKKHCIHFPRTKAIYFSHLIFAMSAFAPIEISYSDVDSWSVNMFSFSLMALIIRHFLPFRLKLKWLKNVGAKIFIANFIFFRIITFSIKYKSNIVFSVFHSLDQI